MIVHLPKYAYEYLLTIYNEVEAKRWKTGEIIKKFLTIAFIVMSGVEIYHVAHKDMDTVYLLILLGMFFAGGAILIITKLVLDSKAKDKGMFIGNFLKNTRYETLMRLTQLSEELIRYNKEIIVLQYPEAYAYIAKVSDNGKTRCMKIPTGIKYYKQLCYDDIMDFSIIDEETERYVKFALRQLVTAQ